MTPTTELAEKLEMCVTESGGIDLRNPDLLRQAADTLRKQAEELERCRTALRPFAEYAHHMLEEGLPRKIAEDDGTPVWGDSYVNDYDITVGDLRLARSAYNEPKQNGEAK